MNTFLMWLGGVLIAILAALFTVPHFIDWNGYRGVFEEEASRLFGRDVRVGGSVNVRLLPTPYVNFEKLRVADTSGVIGAPLFAADSFTMWLDVPPLLKGIFEARRVELQRPVVRLAVDRSGTPNWTTLEFRPGALPFVPADVTLNSVEIIDGQVAYDAADVGTLAQLEAINGTLATQGLRGPVSFRGFADIAGGTREVRLSTTEISPQGDTRLKATVRQPDGSASHTIEATATALFEDPVFAGALTSTTRLDQARDAPFVDIKAEFKATTKGLQLENALASFEKLGEPQLVTGKIETSWGKQRKISAAMNARWLDFDRLAEPLGFAPKTAPAGSAEAAAVGTAVPDGTNKRPLSLARMFFAKLIELLPQDADLQAEVAVDQARLGGGSLSGINMVLASSSRGLEMRSLVANLPGNTRFDFSGQLTSADDGAAFDGIVFTGGPNLKRALAWAVPGDDDFAGFANGDFSFSGRMMVGADVLALSDATAQFNGSSMRGDLRWAGGPVPKLNVSLRGPVVDTRWFGLTSLKLADLHKAAQALAPGGGTSADGSEASQTSASIDVALDIGELTNGTERLSDVSVKIAHATDRLDIKKLKLSAAGGLDLDVRGELGQADSGSQGELQINIDVPTKTASETLHQIISRQDLIRATDAIGLSKTLSDLGPTRLAMTAKLGQTKQQSVEVVFNGETAGRRIAGQARLDGGLAAWDSAPIDLYATLDANDIVSTTEAIAARLGPVGAATDIATTSPRNAQRFSDNSSPASLEGRIVFKATGTPNERLSWLGDVQSKAINLRWSAVGVAGQDTALQLRSGEIDIVEARVGDLIKLADVQIGRAVHDEKVSGKITTATTDGKLVLASQNLNIAGETLSGTAEVTYPTVTEGTTRAPLIVSAKLRTKKLRAAKVLSGLLGQNALTAPAPRVAFAPIGEAAALTSLLDLQGDAIPLFSNQPFDLSLMTGLSGKLTLRVDELTVSDGLIWRDAKLQLTSTDEKSLALQVLLATTPTGPLTASLDLTRSGAGAAIKGRIQLNDGKLAGLFAPPSPAAAPADGRFDFEANFTGRGLSPRALLAATVGKGEVKLRGLSLNGLAPSKLGADAERLLQTPPDQAIDQSISPTVVGALTGAQVPIGNTAVPFVIRDGNVRFADMAIRADGGRLRGETTINLAQLTVDSAWRVNAENQEVAPDPPVPTPSLAAAPSATIGAPVRSPPAAWPPVRVVFVGPLASLAEVAPQYDTGAFERELAVRRIERVARRLEELRAEDEARAKAAKEREEELERQRQEEEARRKQAAAEERRLRLLRARERTSRSQRTPGGIQLIDPPAAIGFPYE